MYFGVVIASHADCEEVDYSMCNSANNSATASTTQPKCPECNGDDQDEAAAYYCSAETKEESLHLDILNHFLKVVFRVVLLLASVVVLSAFCQAGLCWLFSQALGCTVRAFAEPVRIGCVLPRQGALTRFSARPRCAVCLLLFHVRQ